MHFEMSRTVHCADLQDDRQLLWWLFVIGAMFKPQLKCSQLLVEERAGLEFQFLILQHAAIDILYDAMHRHN